MTIFSQRLRVGIDMGSTTIKVAGIRQKGQAHQLQFYDVVDLVKEYAPDSIDDICDDYFVEQLNRLATSYNMRNTVLTATLPVDSAVIHLLDLDTSQTEVEAAETIQDELQQVSHEDLDKMQIVVHPVGPNSSHGNRQRFLACAVPTATIQRTMKILGESRLQATVLDLDALGLYNALYYFCNKKISFPLTLVHIGSQYTICSILLPTKNPFFKVIKLGGRDLTSKIMEEFHFSYAKAEAMKNRFLESTRTRSGAYRKTDLHDILVDFAEKIAADVKRCIRHFQTFEGVVENGQIYATGGCAKLEVLVQAFAEVLEAKVHTWNPLDHFVKTSNQQDEESRRQKGIHLTPTIGTLLRGD